MNDQSFWGISISISTLTVADILQFATTILIGLTLFYIALQANYTRKTLENTACQAKYMMYFEMNRLLVDDPSLQLLISRSSVLHSISKEEDLAKLKRKSFIELILDIAEFQLLTAPRRDRQHVDAYIARLASNPYIREYWTSEQRGTYQKELIKILDGAIEKERS